MTMIQNRSERNCVDRESKHFDELLATALTPDVQPERALNEQILRRAKEEAQMKEEMKNGLKMSGRRSRKRMAVAAAIAAAVLAVGGGTTYAAWRYLTPQEAAAELQDKKLVHAFSGEDAILVNETQTYGDYRTTLIGIVSGKDLTDYAMTTGGEIRADRSYWLLAIEHVDGTPMPDTGSPEYGKETFLTSPFIQGLEPWKYNIYTFGGGYSEFVQDGVMYRMAECDDLELFADKEVYLCLADENSVGVIGEAYNYDETTGKITRNEAYDGCNALFILPLDRAKADPKKAESYLRSLEKTPEEEQEEMDKELEHLPESQRKEMEEGEAQTEALGAFVETLTVENIDELCEKVADSEAVVNVNWDSDWVEFSTAGEAGSSGGMRMSEFELLFPDDAPRISILGYGISGGGADGAVSASISVLRRYEDGTITCADYVPKDLNL